MRKCLSLPFAALFAATLLIGPVAGADSELKLPRRRIPNEAIVPKSDSSVEAAITTPTSDPLAELSLQDSKQARNSLLELSRDLGLRSDRPIGPIGD